MKGENSFQAQNAQVLIVDDTPANVEVLFRLLESQLYQITVATNGKRALKIAQRVPPDLILLDVMMPGMDGYETCKRLKEIETLRDVPVIFVTAKTEMEDIIKGFSVGGVDYITKPFRGEEVCARARNHLEIRFLQKERENLIAQLDKINRAHLQQAEHLRSIVDHVADGILTLDPHGVILSINPAVTLLFGYEESFLLGKELSTLLEPPYDADYRYFFQHHTVGHNAPEAQPQLSREAVGQREDGSTFPFDFSLSEMYTDQHLFIGVLHDISLHKHVEQELRRLSGMDALTNIANRRHFNETLTKEWPRAQRSHTLVAIILIDVDFFKRYNDCYGHQAGDQCLRRVAQVIDSITRRPSDVAARYGGEEFVVLLPDTDAQGAENMAEAIRSDIEDLHIPHAESDAAASVTISVGVSTCIPGMDDHYEALIERADQCLYKAKAMGRNQVVMRANDG